MEVHCRKAGLQDDDGFSLLELQGWSISCRRCNVHLSLLGPETDGPFQSRILLLESVIDSFFPVVDIDIGSPFQPLDSILVRFPLINFLRENEGGEPRGPEKLVASLCMWGNLHEHRACLGDGSAWKPRARD